MVTIKRYVLCMKATLDVATHLTYFGLMNAENAALFRFPMKNFKNDYENI